VNKRRAFFSVLLCCCLSFLSLVPGATSADAPPPAVDSISLSFPSPQLGYVLSLHDCASHPCATLRVTRDSGTEWSGVPLPHQLDHALQIASWRTYPTVYPPLTVHFADARNGWIYGVVPSRDEPANLIARIWSTHDGGQVWDPVRLGPMARGGEVIQMATHGKWTYLFGASFETGRAYLLSAHSNEDHWTNKSTARVDVPAGGTQLEGSFTFAGSNGWFVAGNDRGLTGSARLLSNGSWGAWNGPSIGRGTSSFSPIDAATSRVLLFNGQSTGFGFPPASSVPPGWNNGAAWLFVSYNAGATFKPLRRLSNTYQGGYSTQPGSSATPAPGTIVLTANSDSHLVRSTDWGRTWRVVLDETVSRFVFTNRLDGFALVRKSSSALASSLFRTVDGGIHWEEVTL
jgi:hypothetical protein